MTRLLKNYRPLKYLIVSSITLADIADNIHFARTYKPHDKQLIEDSLKTAYDKLEEIFTHGVGINPK